MSNIHFKSDALNKEYQQLNPILRMSMGVITLMDKSLIITDAQRNSADYAKMGMKTKKNSLHYKQSNGYVHAIDIRTKNRTLVAIFCTKIYFKLMGFQVLHHTGTAEHIHISLFSHDLPNQI